MKKQRLSFKELFTAENIAEPLASVTLDNDKEAKRYFYIDNYDVIGFRKDDEVVGYIKKNKVIDLQDLKKHVVRFNVSDLITNNTSLIECLRLLKERCCLFVIVKSQVESIITMSDIQKPAVKMLFFGIVTFFESSLADLINETYPQNSWKELISPRKVEAATEMFERLIVSKHETNLINCTQFYDKTDIICENQDLLRDYIHLGRSEAKHFFSTVKDLRNDLAHAQSLTVWFTEKDVIEMMDELIIITERIHNRKK